jgi:hypothetical protein
MEVTNIDRHQFNSPKKAWTNWKSGEKANSNIFHAKGRKLDSIQQCTTSAALAATLK